MRQCAIFLFAFLSTTLAAAEFRLDISGRDNVLTPGRGEVKFDRAAWVSAAERPGYLVVSKEVGGEWTPIEFSFVAEKDGFLWLAFGGGWAAAPGARAFILVDDIKFNGQEAPNGGFETLKPDLSAPRIWNLAPKSKACLVDDARQGKKAMKINHDNRIGQGVKVEAGKSYTISLFAKAAK